MNPVTSGIMFIEQTPAISLAKLIIAEHEAKQKRRHELLKPKEDWHSEIIPDVSWMGGLW